MDYEILIDRYELEERIHYTRLQNLRRLPISGVIQRKTLVLILLMKGKASRMNLMKLYRDKQHLEHTIERMIEAHLIEEREGTFLISKQLLEGLREEKFIKIK